MRKQCSATNMGITDRGIGGLRKAIIISVIYALLSTFSADKTSKLEPTTINCGYKFSGLAHNLF